MNDMKRDGRKLALIALITMAVLGGGAWLSLQPGGIVASEMERVARIKYFGNLEYRKIAYERVRDNLRDRDRELGQSRRERQKERAELLGLPADAEQHVHHWYVRKDRVPSKVIPSATRVVDQFHCPVCDEPLNLHHLQRAEKFLRVAVAANHGNRIVGLA